MNLIVNVVLLTILSLLLLTLCNSQNTKSSSDKKNYTESEIENELPLNPDEITYGRPRWNLRRTYDSNSTLPSGRLKGMTNKEFKAYKFKMRYERLYKITPFAHNRTKEPMDCYYSIPKTKTPEKYYTPLLFMSDTVDGTILHPDIFGFINIKKNSFFKLSCPGSYFNMPSHESFVSEITVKCLKKEYIKYKSKEYKLSNFSCSAAPKAIIKATDTPCQGNNKLLEVGFQTVERFITLYRICFDFVRQNPIYSWYVKKRPVSRYRQIIRYRPKFILSQRYDGIDVAKEMYMFNYLKKIVESRFNSTILIKYGHIFNKRFLIQEELTDSNDFPYIYEGLSTFFTENSVPQWRTFADSIWKNVESSLRYENVRGVNQHVVLTGTYLTFTMHDDKEVEHELYLNPPNRIPVPLYIWKMDYDIDMKNGIVYVGLNDPFVNVSSVKPICNQIPCRKSLKVRNVHNKVLLYCCSKESFENTYGKIDPIVYEIYH